ncbi:MAG: DNA polymerase [Minisyncoccia bacterium]
MAAKNKKRLILLDTHAILHRAYHAMPEFSSSKGEPTGGLYGLITMILKIVADLKPDYIVAAYDLPKPTYRHLAYEKYKATRPQAADDLVAQIIRSRDVIAALGIPIYEKEGFEADDILGTIVEELKKKKEIDIIIASGDMDTMQLVDDKKVQVYTLKKGIQDTILYDEKAVLDRFGFAPDLIPDYKGLRGDPSDNIPGVAGIGEKTATELIIAFGSIENLYKVLKKNPEKLAAAGIKKGVIEKLTSQEEEARFSKMLATIRRDAPIDFKLLPKEWRAGVDSSKALDLIRELEFRSLGPRVRAALGAGTAALFEVESEEKKENVPPAQFARVALAVSLIDSTISEPDATDMYRMGKSDSFAEAEKNILNELKKRELEFVYEKIELPLGPVLRRMEERGIAVDKPFLAGLSKQYHQELDGIASEIYRIAGREFNVNSPKQLGEVLFDELQLSAPKQKKTAGGARSTRESELEKLRDTHPIVEQILAYRAVQKLLSTYIDTIPNLVGHDGRLHTTFVQIGAATGRLASKDPNLQNIPIKTEQGRAIRRAFVAEKGCEFLSFDYSQIELRIAAMLSGDEELAQIFRAGRDVHAEVAARIFGVYAKDVSYEQRRRAKVINFGILYGMGVTALQQSLGASRAEAQDFYNRYFAEFSRLAEYLDEVKADAARRGYTATFFGRRRYFEGIRSSIPYVRAAAERMAINAPMQGTQADIVKLAMIQIDDLFQKEKVAERAHMLLQVHDELLFEIDTDLIEALAPKIKSIMENVVSEKDRRSIPFIANGMRGKNWGEMKKLAASH